MKTKDLIIYSLIFLASVVFTSDVVSYQLTGRHIFSHQPQTSTIGKETKCTDTAVVPRPSTTDPQLTAVKDYDAVCQSQFFNQMMVFTNMPISNENAVELADKMTERLKKFDDFAMTPIVIVEPDSEWGLIDFHEFSTGLFDEWITTYFARMKANGISDEQIGVWIPFPEPQQPFWNNNGDPDDFAKSVNRYFKSLRSVYPTAKTAILLDSMVGSDEASQLVAYTRLIDENLVDIAGLQGFPWHPSEEGDSRQAVTSASRFAPAYMIEEVAKSLNTKEVLINTGTYRHRKAQNGGDNAIPTRERKDTLDSIAYEASLLRKSGYSVTVNVFAENKLATQEGVDWSYWQAGKYDESTHTALFTQFIRRLSDNEVTISLFDSRNSK